MVEKSCADLLRAHPRLNRVWVVDTRAWRKTLMASKTRQEISKFVKEFRQQKYDLLVDLQGNSKSGLITLLAKADAKVGFNWKCVPEKPNLLATTHHYFVPPELSVRKRYLHLVQSHLQETHKAIDLVPVELEISQTEEQRLGAILQEPALSNTALLMVCFFGSKWKNKSSKKKL